jgi:hypothetical protein
LITASLNHLCNLLLPEVRARLTPDDTSAITASEEHNTAQETHTQNTPETTDIDVDMQTTDTLRPSVCYYCGNDHKPGLVHHPRDQRLHVCAEPYYCRDNTLHQAATNNTTIPMPEPITSCGHCGVYIHSNQLRLSDHRALYYDGHDQASRHVKDVFVCHSGQPCQQRRTALQRLQEHYNNAHILKSGNGPHHGESPHDWQVDTYPNNDHINDDGTCKHCHTCSCDMNKTVCRFLYMHYRNVKDIDQESVDGTDADAIYERNGEDIYDGDEPERHGSERD